MFGMIVNFGAGFTSQGSAGKVVSEAKAKPKTKTGKKAKMGKTMKEFSKGQLHSGSKTGPVVKNRKQAIAIGLSQSGQSRKK